jgi:peptidoglycan hydrolase-like protein with peptidoglycan-binding domain
MHTVITPTTIDQTTTKPKCCKPILQLGAHGKQVAELQRLLNYWGTYQGELDHEFGQVTEQAVRSFQHKVFLPVDGVVDALTWQALYSGSPVHMPVLKLGCTGDLVKVLQRTLRINDLLWAEVTGEFDCFTDAAVRNFQKRCGLVIDGIVGFYTWRSLSKLPH